MKRFLLVLALACATLGRPAGQPPAIVSPSEATITICSASDVGGDRFALSEIAVIEARDPTLKDRLGKCEIGVSPLPGLSRMLRLVDISARLRSQGFDLSRTRIEMPASVSIRRVFAEISSEQLLQCAREAALEAAGSVEGSIAFEAAFPLRPVRCAPGEAKLQAGAVRGLRSGGNITVPVTIQGASGPPRTVEVVLRVKRLVRGLVASRTIEAGTTLTSEDLGEGEFETSPSPGARLATLDEIIGRKTRTRIEVGKPILSTMLAAETLVRAGGKVTVESVAGAVRISAEGTARSSGVLGEKVVVQIEATKRTVSATVTAKDTVRLEEIK